MARTVSRAYPVKDQIVANLLEADDIVYVPLLNDGVIAVSKLDYNEIWASRDIAGVWAQPLLVDDMLVIPSVNHFLYAFDRHTGAVIWEVDLGGSVASTPLLANDRIYIGSFNRAFFEISLDGQILKPL